MTLDDSSIAILGGEVPTSDGIAISAEMKTYNIDNGDWTSQPGKKRPAGTNQYISFSSNAGIIQGIMCTIDTFQDFLIV